MTSYISPRLALYDRVEAALLAVKPEDGYVYDLSGGIATQKVAVEQVQLDALPWVILRVGDEVDSDRPISQGKEIVNVDVAIGFLVKPDPSRWAGQPLHRLLEWGIWDVRRTMERNAGASEFGMVATHSVSVVYGPLDSFALASFVYTYGLRLTRGQ